MFHPIKFREFLLVKDMSFTFPLTSFDVNLVKLMSAKIHHVGKEPSISDIFVKYKQSPTPSEFQKWFWRQSYYVDRIFRLDYKYDEEFIGRPTFLAKNLVRGISQRMIGVGIAFLYLLGKELGEEEFPTQMTMLIITNQPNLLPEFVDSDDFNVKKLSFTDQTEIGDFFEGKYINEDKVIFHQTYFNEIFKK